MCGITAEIMNENTATVVQQNRLKWNGHVFGKDDEDWLNKVNFETDQGSNKEEDLGKFVRRLWIRKC